MTVLRELWALLRDLPNRFARWCDRTAMEAHRSEMVPADDTAEWPDGVMPWCRRCGGAWPCKPYAEASDRVMDGREDGS